MRDLGRLALWGLVSLNDFHVRFIIDVSGLHRDARGGLAAMSWETARVRNQVNAHIIPRACNSYLLRRRPERSFLSGTTTARRSICYHLHASNPWLPRLRSLFLPFSHPTTSSSKEGSLM